MGADKDILSGKVRPDLIREEIAKGGTESPCPFCGVPRSRRSNYIRCGRCGINWDDGTALDRDPSIERKQAFMASMEATAKTKTPKQDDKGRS